MNYLEVLQGFGFPIACVVALGMYIAKVQKENREDSEKRENLYRQDTKEREERLLLQLGEMSSTNKMLLETNAVLARDINSKLDKLIDEIKN